MERLKLRLSLARQAVARFEEALQIPQPSKLERDGAIQRFEYTFEATWKACQRYLDVVEGLECASPKTCLRLLRDIGLLNDKSATTALEMVDDRNNTVHTYNEALAEKIFAHLPQYCALLKELLQSVERKIKEIKL
ncbi:MAG: nucleotidyltransferase substrate binding protein [Gammaproteobacteria bacterium]|nr:nucleotidyltransferase substrate binding protein [Gammaproteobacteria bacterium]